MKTYRLEILPQAKRNLRQAPRRIALEAGEAILDLRFDPCPPHSQELSRELFGWRRIRIDGWRIIYAVNEPDAVVTVLAVRPRDARTYLGLP